MNWVLKNIVVRSWFVRIESLFSSQFNYLLIIKLRIKRFLVDYDLCSSLYFIKVISTKGELRSRISILK